jgi:predicted RNA-binding Zn-ribbon protein involved in translation (DUF1610 family)
MGELFLEENKEDLSPPLLPPALGRGEIFFTSWPGGCDKIHTDIRYSKAIGTAGESMPNLITLVCPSCGGKLKISPNAVTMTCQFCGNEHMVKHEEGGIISLEAYARCPVCGRNDKVEKVSAILVSQTQEISGTEKNQLLVGPTGQQQLVTRDIPFTRKQISVLGQRLVAPDSPSPSSYPPFPPAPILPSRPSKGGAVSMIVIGIIIAVIAFVSGACGGIMFIFALADTDVSGSAGAGLTGLLILLISGIALLAGVGLAIGGAVVRKKVKATPDPQIEIRLHYQKQVDAVQRERERIDDEYKRAMERYEKLYYCFRDDCVFIPGETTSSPLARMGDYLYATSPETRKD